MQTRRIQIGFTLCHIKIWQIQYRIDNFQQNNLFKLKTKLCLVARTYKTFYAIANHVCCRKMICNERMGLGMGIKLFDFVVDLTRRVNKNTLDTMQSYANENA